MNNREIIDQVMIILFIIIWVTGFTRFFYTTDKRMKEGNK